MSKERIKAVVSSVVVIAVAVCSALGLDVDGDALTNVICAALLVASTAYGCWKNHNFTEAAAGAQVYLDLLKGEDEDMRDREDVEVS